MNNNLPIGIFDSGLGGLTVLKSLKKLLPQESFIYIGDTAHVPYGNKSPSAIINYSIDIATYLDQQPVKLIIIACNTASSIAKKRLSLKLSTHIIDVITPIQKLLAEHSTINKIGIIGTHNTIKSRAYEEAIYITQPKIKIYSNACPLFVPIIEEGLYNHKIAHIIAQEYLKPLIKQKIQALILGCTHYPIMKSTILEILPKDILLFDSAEVTAHFVREFLKNNQMLCKTKGATLKILSTDQSVYFEKFAIKLFNDIIKPISVINISK